MDGQRTAEVGYRLQRAAWGRGYATEGLGALVDQAFDALGFNRVRALTMTVNAASRRVLEKAGFRHVETAFPAGVHPLPGSEAGEVVYERLRAPQRPEHARHNP